ncbi:MAG: hypothetical protein ABI277_02155 [Burkholderiaceae bacterium]
MNKQPIEQRPNYFYGQLLTEKDLAAEQDYHSRARESLNQRLFGWGIVSGLEVEASGDSAVKVAPGVAIDSRGRELRVRDAAIIELTQFPDREVLKIGLHYEEDEGGETSRRTSYAVIEATRQSETRPYELILARVELDDRGRVQPDNIDRSPRASAGMKLGPDSIKAEYLEERLRQGWIRLTFRPAPLDIDPASTSELAPPFRVGATETRSHTQIDGVENKRGAGGTMAIPIPAGVVRVLQFRIAGAHNTDDIELRLVRGGWDAAKGEHVRRYLVGGQTPERIKASKKNAAGRTPYDVTFDVKDGALDAESSTLSLWLRGIGGTAVSLVAVRFSYA